MTEFVLNKADILDDAAPGPGTPSGRIFYIPVFMLGLGGIQTGRVFMNLDVQAATGASCPDGVTDVALWLEISGTWQQIGPILLQVPRGIKMFFPFGDLKGPTRAYFQLLNIHGTSATHCKMTCEIGSSEMEGPVHVYGHPFRAISAQKRSNTTQNRAIECSDAGDLCVQLGGGSSTVGKVDQGAAGASPWPVSDASILAKLDVALSTRAAESGGNLDAIKADVDKIPAKGSAASAGATPVVVATDDPVGLALIPVAAQADQILSITDSSTHQLSAAAAKQGVLVSNRSTSPYPVLAYAHGGTGANGREIVPGDEHWFPVSDASKLDVICPAYSAGTVIVTAHAY
jgi:hypothetical protein